MVLKTLTIFLLLSSALSLTSDSHERPFYIIGHMVNRIGLIVPFLKAGSNVLESDVHFGPDGSVKRLYHGFPCDLGRTCEDMEDVGRYLEAVKGLTDPRSKDGYYGQLVMLFFDLKMGTSGDLWKSGADVVRHLVEHLWSGDGSREQEMRVLLYIENELNSDFILGFIDGIKQHGHEHRLRDIGFDAGPRDIDKTRRMFESLNVTITNIWQGDGITNFVRIFRGDGQLRRLISVRDSDSGFIRKVYDWTVDQKSLMRKSLRSGVDGMITNKPRDLLEVLDESGFKQVFRLATIDDDPFARFNGIV